MELIRSLIGWLAAHPNLAAAFVGAAAFSESLAFVGLLIPGATILFAAGALIAGGTLTFWPVVIAAAAGAIAGDAVSYWLGRHYRQHVRLLRPFAKHPALLQRGEAFFYRHGGKSVVLGRFVGPVRPVIPIVAGMLGMPPLRFYVTNILSGLGWAPAYLLPGMAFGASLALAGEVAARLAAMLAIVLISAWAITWLVRTLFRVAQPHAAEWARRCLRWSRSHRVVGRLVGDLIDPAAPASRALLLWMAMLLGGTWLFFGVMEDVVTQDRLVLANEAIYQMLQTLRTPVGDRVMVVFSELGDWPVTTATTAAALLWLGWRRAGRDAAYWLTVIGFALLAVVALKWLLHLPRPVPVYSGASAYSFPSGHATMSVVIYGYLAVLGARDLAVRWRWLPYAGGTVLVVGIAFSRLYLGVHWFADVLAGLGMGTAGVSLIAIARFRHVRTETAHGILWVTAATLLAAGAWHARTASAADLARYAVRHPIETMSAARWWQGGWQRLPAYRIDLGGEREQPLNVQWAGTPDELERQLLGAGWSKPTPLRPRSALRWFSPEPSLSSLPLVPQLNDGRPEALTLTLDAGAAPPGRALLLRLWPTSFRLEPEQRAVWVGTVAWLEIARLPLVSLPRTRTDYDDAAEDMLAHLQALNLQTKRPKREAYRTLLLAPAN